MLRHKMLQPWAYNEIVVDTDKWIKHLPATLEAIFYFRNGESKTARDLHKRFLKRFPDAKTPLVSFDVTNAKQPFAEPDAS